VCLARTDDTHGNVSWLQRVVFAVAVETSADLIVQVGDFGWWPRVITGDAFISVARSAPVPLWWIDGNHEDHAQLATAIDDAGGPSEDGTVGLGGALSFVPRGTRFVWDGVTVVAVRGRALDRPAVVHGHYHSAYRRALDTGWGRVDVEGLSEDGTPGNIALLECRSERWTIEPIESVNPRRDVRVARSDDG
jgi:hypothetical protein